MMLKKTGSRIFPAVGAIAFLATAALAAPPTSKSPPPAQPAAPARALPPMPDPSKDDPAKVAAAKQFIIAYHPRMDPKSVAAMIDRGMPRSIQAAKEDNPKLDVQKYARETKARMLDMFHKQFDQQAHVVSRHFSLQELNALTAFFRGPLGKRLVEETPNIRRDMFMENRRARQAAMAARAKQQPNGDEEDDAEDSAKALTSAKPKPHK